MPKRYEHFHVPFLRLLSKYMKLPMLWEIIKIMFIIQFSNYPFYFILLWTIEIFIKLILLENCLVKDLLITQKMDDLVTTRK